MCGDLLSLKKQRQKFIYTALVRTITDTSAEVGNGGSTSTQFQPLHVVVLQ